MLFRSFGIAKAHNAHRKVCPPQGAPTARCARRRVCPPPGGPCGRQSEQTDDETSIARTAGAHYAPPVLADGRVNRLTMKQALPVPQAHTMPRRSLRTANDGLTIEQALFMPQKDFEFLCKEGILKGEDLSLQGKVFSLRSTRFSRCRYGNGDNDRRSNGCGRGQSGECDRRTAHRPNLDVFHLNVGYLICSVRTKNI